MYRWEEESLHEKAGSNLLMKPQYFLGNILGFVG